MERDPVIPQSNRAILLTPPGVAAIAVIRIVGPKMREFVQSRFSAKLKPGAAVHGIFRDSQGNEIDDPVIAFASDERFADINLHGGAWVIRAVLNEAVSAGFEVVERVPMPLPEDAIEGKAIIEREIAACLPLATTELALRTLLSQENAWRELQSRFNTLQRQEIDAILADRSLHWLLHPPRVAIIGAANVGKSTLANHLFAQERSITADLPGTTRDWVGEMANLDGLAVQLVDTPGIRETNDPIEREAILRSDTQIQRADLVVLVLDASRPLEPEQSPLLRRYSDALIIVNKVEAVHAWDVASLRAVQTIGTTGVGVDDLTRRIRAYFNCDPVDPARPRCWTERQRELLKNQIPSPE